MCGIIHIGVSPRTVCPGNKVPHWDGAWRQALDSRTQARICPRQAFEWEGEWGASRWADFPNECKLPESLPLREFMIAFTADSDFTPKVGVKRGHFSLPFIPVFFIPC